MNTPFTELVLDILENNVRTHTYRLRAQLLSEIAPTVPSKLDNDVYVVNCDFEIGWIARKLIRPMKTAAEEVKCTKCPFKKTTELFSLLVTDNNAVDFEKKAFVQKTWEQNVTTSSICPKCKSQTEAQLISVGKQTYCNQLQLIIMKFKVLKYCYYLLLSIYYL